VEGTAVRSVAPVPGRVAVEQGARAALRELTGQLRAARRELRITQEALAVGLGVSVLALVNWENGKDVPSVEHLVRWAETLRFILVVDGAARSGLVPVPRAQESVQTFRIRCLATALAQAREQADLTQDQIGDRLGVSAWSVHMWETGRRTPRTLRLITWCGTVNRRLTLHAR
jgi:transcriptional regulator with XRE-family HTH domain